MGSGSFSSSGQIRTGLPTMTEVSPVALPGLPYARVGTSDPRTVLYLPLFLSRQAEFERLVAQYAGPGHPLVTFFESRERNPTD